MSGPGVVNRPERRPVRQFDAAEMDAKPYERPWPEAEWPLSGQGIVEGCRWLCSMLRTGSAPLRPFRSGRVVPGGDICGVTEAKALQYWRIVRRVHCLHSGGP